MKSFLNSVVVGSTILYILLFPWPIYMFLFVYIGYTSEKFLLTILLMLTFAIEIVIGVFLSLRQFNKQKEAKKISQKTVSWILFSLTSLSVCVYAISVLPYVVKVLPVLVTYVKK